MASELRNYKNSVDVSVEKGLGGSYIVNVSEYSFGEKVRENSYNFSGISDQESDPLDSNTGVYQALHPSTYLTDTSIQDYPLDLSSNFGLKKAFMNCSSLANVNLSSDVIIPSFGALDNSYAFSGCTSLTSVNLGDIKLGYYINPDSPRYDLPTTPSFLCMFDGCSNLTSISGDIYFTDIDPDQLAHMFRGCSNLNCSNLNIYNGYTDSENDLFQKYINNELEIDGQNYTYSYEALGLTKAQLHQATIYDDSGRIISDFEVFS